MSDLFSLEETQKRRIKDLNRELLHVRNLAEKFREENKQAQEKITQLKAQLIDQGQRFNDQSQKVRDLEYRLKQSESKSLMAMIHGTCECGTAWSSIVSDKEGFGRLHCFNCKNDRYENIEVFGDYSPKVLRGES